MGNSTSESFPIFQIGQSYLVFDVNTIALLRRKHNICGVLLGSIPRAPEQNVFSGIPLELMPEEARLLVTKGFAYLVDSSALHKQELQDVPKADLDAFLVDLKQRGLDFAQEKQKTAELRKAQWHDKVKAKTTPSKKQAPSIDSHGDADNEESLFDSTSSSPTPTVVRAGPKLTPYPITPTTSCPPLKAVVPSTPLPLPDVPKSYPLYELLHSSGYFIIPGLRFGCDYSAYPGDPLRFHSHFLAVGKGWNEPIDLLDIVGGGRLGTSVKKGYMLGGELEEDDGTKTGELRAFSIEWAAM
jgi:tRNA-splicing endonuclease subunit Sen34